MSKKFLSTILIVLVLMFGLVNTCLRVKHPTDTPSDKH